MNTTTNFKPRPASKAAIYSLTDGELCTSSDLTEEEKSQALKDIAATFTDERLPDNATMVVWDRGRVTGIMTDPCIEHTDKIFYKVDQGEEDSGEMSSAHSILCEGFDNALGRIGQGAYADMYDIMLKKWGVDKNAPLGCTIIGFCAGFDYGGEVMQALNISEEE